MPVVLTLRDDSFVLEVPACAGRDGIATFDLAAGSTVSEGRSAGERDDERTIELVVSPPTMTDGSYNPDEVRVVSNVGEIGSDPFALDVYVSTARGFAEFAVAGIVDRAPLSTLVITGRDEFRVGSPNDAWVQEWCSAES